MLRTLLTNLDTAVLTSQIFKICYCLGVLHIKVLLQLVCLDSLGGYGWVMWILSPSLLFHCCHAFKDLTLVSQTSMRWYWKVPGLVLIKKKKKSTGLLYFNLVTIPPFETYTVILAPLYCLERAAEKLFSWRPFSTACDYIWISSMVSNWQSSTQSASISFWGTRWRHR